MMWKRPVPDAPYEDAESPLPPPVAPSSGGRASAEPTSTGHQNGHHGQGSDHPARYDTAQEDAAIDTVVSILRSMGRFGIDLGDEDPAVVRRRFESWATHLAIGGPHPDHQPAEDSDARPALTRHRDWGGARRFVQAHRQHESEVVARTVTHSHELIWDLTAQMAQTLTDTRDRDREVLEQLERLRSAILSRSLATIEQEVSGVVKALGGAVRDREQRLKIQLDELGTRVTELSEQLQEVKVESRLDGLTRIPNRTAFDGALRRWHHVGAAFERSTCLILVDVDYLKTINDQYGHRAGDAALRVFADCLSRSFPRRSDFVGRYGGDEFAVLLADTPGRSALRLAERFRQMVRSASVEHDDHRIELTTSMGVAELEPLETVESWLERADQALYRAKQAGRDQVAFARPTDQQSVIKLGIKSDA
jgi:diguanylate cyclase